MQLFLFPTEQAQSYYSRPGPDHGPAYPGDAGVDVFVPEDIFFQPHETKRVPLGIKGIMHRNDVSGTAYSSFPHLKETAYYMYPRSSIAKTPFRLANSVGIIDASYRGELCAMLDNHSSYPQVLRAGAALLQICAPTLEPIRLTVLKSQEEWDKVATITLRGERGFGSSDDQRSSSLASSSSAESQVGSSSSSHGVVMCSSTVVSPDPETLPTIGE